MARILSEDIPELERDGVVKNATRMDYPRTVWQHMAETKWLPES